MTVDSLTFLGESIFGVSSTPRTLLAALDGAGVERAVACPAKPPGYHLGRRTTPSRRRSASPGAAGQASHASTPSSGRMLRTSSSACLDRPRAAGALPASLGGDVQGQRPRVAAVVEVARAHRAPVVIASGYPWLSEALQVADLVRRFPDVRFLATNGIQINMSGLGQTDAELALAANDNLSITTTGIYREDFIRAGRERHGAGRVLFASAYPHFDPRLELLRIEWAGFDDHERAAMVGGNAEALFRR